MSEGKMGKVDIDKLRASFPEPKGEDREDLEHVLSTLKSARDYAVSKDMMNSAWHRKPVQHRELTLELIRAAQTMERYLEVDK